MSNVFSLDARRQQQKQRTFIPNYGQHGSFSEEVNKDVLRLATATNVTEEEAMKIAEDFYMRYPILIEHIRNMKYVIGK